MRVTDRALSGPVPTDADTPDLERKLAGEQKPRGWGLFLIEHMVDSMDVSTDDDDPDRDTAPGARGADRWMTDEFDAQVEGGRRPRSRDPACSGDLDSRADEALAAAYARGRGGWRRRGSPSTSGHVGYINSTGIALIVRLLAEARRDGRTVRAIGLTPHYREIFRITRLSDFMDIVEGRRRMTDHGAIDDLDRRVAAATRRSCASPATSRRQRAPT